MPCDKASRALKRYHDALAINKQLVICKFHSATMTVPQGVFRKRHALNCGRARCHLCTNPRRLWGRLTFPEQRANVKYRQELESI